jgi:hypothetical protein
MPTRSNMNRDIGTDADKIQSFVEKLQQDKFLIPTFQREFVWEPKNIIALWDSILKFYPIGSILYWETDNYLHTHRRLGGFEFPHDEDTVRKFKEWTYILDGQQRATSLLLSMTGGKGKVKGGEDFDYTLYFDATEGMFFFANELEERKAQVDPSFLIRVKDVLNWDFTFYKDISAKKGFNPEIEKNLQQLQRIFTDYKISLIRIKGVGVNEVCDIFERINQEGKKLDPVDIIVARTYRNENVKAGITGFYLRDNLRNLERILSSQGSQFQFMEDLTVIQMISLCLRKQTGETRFGMTPAALYNLETKDFEDNWDSCQKTVLETIKLLSDLKIQGPNMLPFIYLVHPICHYLHLNLKPNNTIAKQWFWATAFGREDFRRATDVYEYCTEFFDQVEGGNDPSIHQLIVSKTKLVQTDYYYRDALSRAVLSFFAYQMPRDFTDYSAEVLDNVYPLLTHAPNLHHIYPQNFLYGIKGLPSDVSPDSLMNICYLRAKTNIQISDRSPLSYFKDFQNVHFEEILESHLIPREFVDKQNFAPTDYRSFLYARAEILCSKLKEELPNVDVKIVD